MPNKMLIDASHREETRVVVVRGNRIEEFDFESQDKKQLRGNIYLARVTRVEPSLQAAFVEYGGNRHGFLAFSEIHPDYYQIPVADRQALVQAEAEAAAEDEDNEDEGKGRRRRRAKTRGGDDGAKSESAANDEGTDGESVSESNGDNGDNGDEDVEFVGAEDALEEVQNRRKPVRKNYKIQEVIKRRQIMLVQVVKEERGNKGAALTTYLSLAGRYSVLMPNTARGGGISRKITQPQDRKRLKEMVRDLEVPEGMGVILRTAGQSRTKAEVKRDYEYLMRLWETVRNQTLESIAPSLVYEEGSLIKRSVRDLYNKDISEIQVAGEDGYREAKSFMRMLMPSHAKVVQPYRDRIPIFARNGIEAQLDKMLQPQVTLKSGGYVIINQTEALVAIDVNSGRSTREHSIEDTALQTNLEAAEEIARQLRLRDLAGLIVIDFIDMEENRNNRAVEKKLKECLKNDRARIQVGRISHFGLLEMSRQRIRASVLESTMQTCPHCGGAGHVRSESSVALLVVRAIEEYLLKDSRNNITVRTPTSTALYVLNHKRANLIELEERFGPTISIEADDTVGAQHYAIFKGEPAERIVIDTPQLEEMAEDDEPLEELEAEADTTVQEADGGDGEDGQRKRRRRRRRRGGRDRDREPAAETRHVEESVRDLEDGLPAPVEAEHASDRDEDGHSAHGEDGDGKKRRRGRRGGRRNRRDQETAPTDATQASEQDQASGEHDEQPDFAAQEAIEQTRAEPVAEFLSGGLSAPPQEEPEPAEAQKPKRAPRRRAKAQTNGDQKEQDAVVATDAEAKVAEDAPKPKRKRAPRKKSEEPQPEKLEKQPEAEPETQEPVVVSAETEEPVEPQVRRSGWWQRRSLF